MPEIKFKPSSIRLTVMEVMDEYVLSIYEQEIDWESSKPVEGAIYSILYFAMQGLPSKQYFLYRYLIEFKA